MNNIDDMASKQVVQINISNFKKNSAMDIKKQFSDDELSLLEDMKILGGLSPEDPTNAIDYDMNHTLSLHTLKLRKITHATILLICLLIYNVMTAQQTSYERNSNYEDYDECNDSIPTVDLDEFVVKGENYNMTGDKISIGSGSERLDVRSGSIRKVRNPGADVQSCRSGDTC